ncbi:MAG: acetylornithine/succinylornithine family transaminase [Ilumatobacteraceae bacterium]|nr:acetylornithine/succinylornithine family transaminase [Ilumatobacteraceae bacterium]
MTAHSPLDPQTSPFMPVFAPPLAMIERGEGCWLWDADGRRYLDLLAGIAVVSLGHAHPAVADAVSAQSRQLLHVSNFFANPQATAAAVAIDELLEQTTGSPGQVFFTNSGAESVECAIKLARKYGGRGRHNVVAMFGSFHGRTLAALAATGQPAKHEPFAPMPEGFRHVAFGDLDEAVAALDPTVAAILVEPILGEGGVHPASAEYLRGLRAACDERGVLMIVDEIQTGLGRTGRWFGFEESGIVPDVVPLAKALGNGMPVGACWARREVAAVFEPGDHGSTYSGTAIATAAVNATIAELRRIDAPARATEYGGRLAAALAAVDGVESVRGRGLMLAAQLADDVAAADVAAAAFARGVIVNAVATDALRLVPPLTIADDEIEFAVRTIAEAIDDVRAGSPGGSP